MQGGEGNHEVGVWEYFVVICSIPTVSLVNKHRQLGNKDTGIPLIFYLYIGRKRFHLLREHFTNKNLIFPKLRYSENFCL